jgi:hypothetical protein
MSINEFHEFLDRDEAAAAMFRLLRDEEAANAAGGSIEWGTPIWP